jgi:hypothetical protein
MNTNRILIGIAVVSGFITLASTALAGYKPVPNPVYIDVQNRFAMGAVGEARNSSSYNEVFGCSVQVRVTDSYLSCVATDANGRTVTCTTSKPQFVQAGLGISGDTSIEFDWDANGECIYIDVTNTSLVAPKDVGAVCVDNRGGGPVPF